MSCVLNIELYKYCSCAFVNGIYVPFLCGLFSHYLFLTNLFVLVYLQVHSLTARSVSRQFREGLKQAQPHTADINIKLKTQVVPIVEKQLNNNNSNNKEAKLSEFQQNYNYDNFTSDDIINDSSREGSIECDTNTGDLCSKKPGSSSNILARAAFWDKRVEEGIIDDSIVIQEFPKMEI